MSSDQANDDGLSDLVEACRAAPDRDGVLRAMIRCARESADAQPAIAYLAKADASRLGNEDTRIAAGDFLMDQGAPEAALAWYHANDPKSMARRARALLVLDRRKEAGEVYREAVRADDDARDPDLDREFALVGRQTGGGADIIHLSGGRVEAPQGGDSAFSLPRERDRITFADIGGLDAVKNQIKRRIILPFQNPSLFRRFRRRSGGGILLHGPPGCGKTMFAKATAGECNAKFVVIRIPEILDMYIGESEKRLASAFEAARADRPAVLFFDEIEAIASRRRFDTNSTQSSLVSTFLSELDGVDVDNEGVLILAATNVPWAIDGAFRRPGRFDRVMFVPPPDRVARVEILRSHLKGRPQAQKLNLEAIAAKTAGYSGADLAGLVEAATDLAIDESLHRESGLAPITQAHLADAIREQKATTTEWLTTARNYAKYSNEGGLYDDVVAFLEKHTR